MVESKKNFPLIVYYYVIIIYLELMLQQAIFGNILNINILFILLFSIPIAAVLTIITSIGNRLINKIILFIITIFLCLIFAGQFIHYKYYEAVFSVYSLLNGGQILGFIGSIIETIGHNIGYFLLILLVPIIFLIVFNKKMKIIKLFSKKAIIYILVLIISQGLVIGSTFIFTDGNYSLHNLYYNVHAPTLSVKKMGLLSTMNLDLFRMITKFKEKVVFNDTLEEKKQEVIYNVMEIDFDSLINNETNDTTKKMHEYFKSLKGTNQNKYTGVFKGKNLIVFVAEAFSTIAIDENLTPTLYKLANEGFRFNNFYTPVFYVSTSDGEYTTLTSLLPKEGVWSMKKSSDIYLPFVYGNLFKKLGYNARAYHNGNYKYYSRHLSHPNMGYIYKGCYNGLKINCRKWPQSDLEMIDSTKNEYINDPHYVTYYMTISGHLQYNFYGNNMAYKNQSYVKSLPYSSAVKAYLATQIELDKALQSLIKSLEENNTLDNTVIALSADHYPYGLTYDNIKERATHMTDKKFDIHENSFILWNSKTEGIDVNKYSSSLDILPTVLNMFGVEYDSRLLMGSDIFSDDEGLVIYNDRSWITDKGKYNAVSKVFTPWDSAEVIENDYIAEINNEVYNKFLMSRLILETNYYKKLGI